MYFYKNCDLVTTLFRNKNHCILFIVLGILLQCVEVYLYKYFDLIYVRDHYLMTPLLVVMIFSYVLSVNLQNENIVSVIGKRYSAYIYILHFFVLSRYDNMMRHFNIEYSCLSYIKPFIIFLLTLFMSVAILESYNILKKCCVIIRK